MGTTAHGLIYPEDYNAPADLPSQMEENTLSIEAALVDMDAAVAGAVSAAQSAAPVGTIVMFGGNTAPAGWHLCDGSAHGSSALQAVLGATTTPDLRARFVVGAGSGYTLKQTGGADAVTLTAAQSGLPAHGHTASSDSQSVSHTHAVDPPATWSGTESADHSHGVSLSGGDHFHWTRKQSGTGITGSGVDYVCSHDQTNSTQIVGGSHSHTGNTGGRSAAHSHLVDIGAFTSGAGGGSHAHGVTVANNAAAAASQSHENRPPFYALTFIIKK